MSEVSQTEKDKCDVTESKKKKITQINLFTKQKQTHRLKEWTYSYQRGNTAGKG